MNKEIKALVDKLPLLIMKVNKGEKHRIIHGDITIGSLWVEPYKTKYRVLITGGVDSLLSQYLHQQFGDHKSESRGYKYWFVSDIEDVQKVIRYFGQTSGCE